MPILKAKAQKDWDEQKLQAIHTPRLLSLNSFSELFEEVGTRSTLTDRLDGHDDQIKTIFETLKRLEMKDKLTEEKLYNVEKAFAVQVSDLED